MGPFTSDLLTLLETFAVAALAASAALAGLGRRLDLASICILAVVVGLAGGSLRDVLAGSSVFWIGRPFFLAVCLAAAGVAWAAGERPWRPRALMWLDAAGLSAYAAVSAARAADAGVTPLAAATVGVAAAAASGLIREALGDAAPFSRWRDLHLAPVIAAVGLFVLLRFVGLDPGLSALAGAAAGLALGAARLTRPAPAGVERD